MSVSVSVSAEACVVTVDAAEDWKMARSRGWRDTERPSGNETCRRCELSRNTLNGLWCEARRMMVEYFRVAPCGRKR